MNRFNFSHWAVQNFEALSKGYAHDDGHHRDAHKNTCGWFFNDPRAQAWRNTSQSSIIWVAGSPGVGKSVLSRAVALHSQNWWGEANDQQQAHTHVPTTTTYYDFRAGNASRQSAAPALCAFLHQLFDKGPSPEIIDHTYVRRDAGFLGLKRFNPGSLQNMWWQFEKCARDPQTGQFVCVLDGLDECEPTERGELLTKLGGFVSAMGTRAEDQPRSRVKFFLTSQSLEGGLVEEYERLREAAGSEVTWFIDADEMGPRIRADMDPIIQSMVNIVHRDQREAVERIIRGNDQINWLWLRVAVEFIVNAQNAANRDQSLRPFATDILQNFPKDVEGVCEKALDFASIKYGRELVENLVHIILGARKLLSPQEVVLALAAADKDPSAATSDIKRRPYEELCKKRPELFDLLEILSGVVFEVASISEKVDVSHKTVRAFLTNREESPVSTVPGSPSLSSWRGIFEISAAHATLARACLIFLATLWAETHSYAPGEPGYLKHKRLKQQGKQCPFLRYAAKNWPVHFKLQGESSTRATIQLAQSLCTPEGQVRNNWLYFYGKHGNDRPNDLIIAVQLGLVPLVEKALEKLREMGPPGSFHHGNIDQSEDKSFSCPFYLALDNNDIETTRALFAGGQTLHRDCDSSGCRETLRRPIWNNNPALVQLLLDHGASIENTDVENNDFCPLIYASELGREDIVKILLPRGANPNFETRERENALVTAARGGYVRIVQMLLDHGVHFRLYGITALWHAAQNGDQEIVHLLLEKDVNPNIPPTPQQGGPLSAVVENRRAQGKMEIVRMLLEHGAKPCERDIKSATFQSEELAEMLLDPYISSLLG